MTLEAYETAKLPFVDQVNVDEYIQLDRVSTLYESLKATIEKPLKMILLFGKPGTGKSMMLSRLHSELSASQTVAIYLSPIIEESAFLTVLNRDILDNDTTISFPNLIEALEKKEFTKTPLVLLDEAQLYSDALMEKIRLISDTRKVKFVIVLHKTQEEDLIAKEHFQTRIWESIELHNASLQELQSYIQKKLLKHSQFEIANLFKSAQMRLIYKFTKGNYRDTNKLIFTLFEIIQAYIQQAPSKVSTTSLPKKMIEMAALKTGFIHA